MCRKSGAESVLFFFWGGGEAEFSCVTKLNEWQLHVRVRADPSSWCQYEHPLPTDPCSLTFVQKCLVSCSQVSFTPRYRNKYETNKMGGYRVHFLRQSHKVMHRPIHVEIH